MTNEQIIQEIAIQVYGEDAVMEMLEEGIEIPLHTVQGWASRGPYKIKKGEHGIETRLWKKRKRKDNEKKMICPKMRKLKKQLVEIFICASLFCFVLIR